MEVEGAEGKRDCKRLDALMSHEYIVGSAVFLNLAVAFPLEISH